MPDKSFQHFCSVFLRSLAEKFYPGTFDDLAQCYIAAPPFFCNSIFGDLAYTAAMFGSYRWLQYRRAAANAA
ncbi:MAG: hypothetical protein HY644_08345 [Acidobacteria bacterium]|nr:hypothetical protein [Acidobacteriota bacterium]